MVMRITIFVLCVAAAFVLGVLYWPVVALYFDAIVVGLVALGMASLFVWALVRLPISKVEYHHWHTDNRQGPWWERHERRRSDD